MRLRRCERQTRRGATVSVTGRISGRNRGGLWLAERSPQRARFQPVTREADVRLGRANPDRFGSREARGTLLKLVARFRLAPSVEPGSDVSRGGQCRTASWTRRDGRRESPTRNAAPVPCSGYANWWNSSCVPSRNGSGLQLPTKLASLARTPSSRRTGKSPRMRHNRLAQRRDGYESHG